VRAKATAVLAFLEAARRVLAYLALPLAKQVLESRVSAEAPATASAALVPSTASVPPPLGFMGNGALFGRSRVCAKIPLLRPTALSPKRTKRKSSEEDTCTPKCTESHEAFSWISSVDRRSVSPQQTCLRICHTGRGRSVAREDRHRAHWQDALRAVTSSTFSASVGPHRTIHAWRMGDTLLNNRPTWGRG
jgi:hypothetical protein